ncbi:TPA: hypothetical protein EYP70_03175 [Candidatus Bathyarchaeota archaeon]|nr:hypothetical protein [Candidatus Bathyarchaeota archaeon]
MKTAKVRLFLNGDEKVVAHIHNMAFAEWIKSLGKGHDYRYVTPKDVLGWIEEDYSKYEFLWIAEMDDEAIGYTHRRSEEIHGRRILRGSLRSYKS